MNKHREYLKRRFPFLAAEFDKIPDDIFWDDVFFSVEDWWDSLTEGAVIASSFIWSHTPQGHDFWVALLHTMREKNESN